MGLMIILKSIERSSNNQQDFFTSCSDGYDWAGVVSPPKPGKAEP